MGVAAVGEVVRVVFAPGQKARFRKRCADKGQNMSERIRQLVADDLAAEGSPADRLSAILASASVKGKASGLPEPSIEDIDRFIDEVRDERIRGGFAS